MHTENWPTAKEITKAFGKTERTIQRRANEEGWPFVWSECRGGKVRHYNPAYLPVDVKEAWLSWKGEDLPAESGGNGGLHMLTGAGQVAIRQEVSPPSLYNAESALCAMPEFKRNKALDRLLAVNKARKIKERKGNDGKGKALKQLARETGISLPTLYSHTKIADEALEKAIKDGLDPIEAQIQALAPAWGEKKGNIRAWAPEAVDYAKALATSQHCLNISDIAQYARNECRVNGWKEGSDDSLRRVLARDLPPSVLVAGRKGLKRYKADCALKILRNYAEIWPNFGWCGDHHIFDVFVKFAGKILRPWLTAWMDLRSRSFMGWCISFQPNSQTIAMALAHGILPKNDPNFPQHGLPQSVYVDNGKDYTCKYLTGETIEIDRIDYPDIIERFAGLGIDPFYIDMEYDKEQRAWVKKRGSVIHQVKGVRVGGVYARLGAAQRFARVYSPWSKPIERRFRDVVQTFSHLQPGWCGSGHEQRPEKLAFEIKRGSLLTYADFCDRFYEWVVEWLHNQPHSGHAMGGKSPNEIFTALCPEPVRVEPRLLDFALAKKEQVKIHDWGFNLQGRGFELAVPVDEIGAAILTRLINRWASVYYDFDMKIVRIYLGEEYICDGRPLRRASWIQADDEALQGKLRLQALQQKLVGQTLGEIHKKPKQAPALLAIPQKEQEDAQPEAAKPAARRRSRKRATVTRLPQREKRTEEPKLFLTDRERYEDILARERRGEAITHEDLEHKAEFEASPLYQLIKDAYTEIGSER